MNGRAFLYGLIFAAVLAVSYGHGRACHCGAIPTPAEEFAQVDAVFKGIVLSVAPVPSESYLDVLVLVTGVWKGAVPSFYHAYTGDTDANCGLDFEPNFEYLFYGHASSEACCEGAFTGSCNRTTSLSSAGEDLEFLGDPSPPVPVEAASWGAVKAMYRD